MNFFTSSSKYLWSLSIMLIVFFMVSFFSELYVQRGNHLKDNDEILHIQLEKLKNTEDVEVAFLGDSSLGNAIDAKTIQAHINQKTINLGLTASFGYLGTLNLAQRVYDRNKETLKTIVIMQSLDVGGHDPVWELYRKTKCMSCDEGVTNLFKDIRNKPTGLLYLGSIVDNYLNINYVWPRIISIFSTNSSASKKREFKTELDYFEQGKKVQINALDIEASRYTGLKEENEFLIHRLAQFCREKGIQCIYMHGPMYKLKALALANYTKIINSKIQTDFGTPAIGPYQLEEAMLGDALDHVALPYKEKVTKFYLKALLKEIQNAD